MVIASTTVVSADRLRAAVIEVFESRQRQALPPLLPPPPTSWRRPYATMAGSVGLDRDLTVGYAHAAGFLDPILSADVPATTAWDQERQRWSVVVDEPGDDNA